MKYWQNESCIAFCLSTEDIRVSFIKVTSCLTQRNRNIKTYFNPFHNDNGGIEMMKRFLKVKEISSLSFLGSWFSGS